MADVLLTPGRWVISINTADGELALKRLGRTLYEAACMFYLDDARRRLAVHQERRNPAPQTSAKVAFKVSLSHFHCPREANQTFKVSAALHPCLSS